jgi:hypothetical protein
MVEKKIEKQDSEHINEKPVGMEPQTFHDWELEHWVLLANKYGIEAGVTLQMGGFLITGMITSGKRFMESAGREISKELESSGSPELAKTFREIYREKAKIYSKDEYRPEEEELEEERAAEEKLPLAFIHLRQAFIFFNFMMNQYVEVPCWRGRLDRVDAFFIGNIAGYKPTPPD